MDIVERLRGDYSDERLEIAADEIERLRGIINDDRLEGAADKIERLREALKKIVETEPESDASGDWWHMIIARAALKEDE